MNVMIAGGSGLLGTALTRSLQNDNHKVWILSRNPERTRVLPGVTALAWDGAHASSSWLDAFPSMDAIVNLAGATIGQWPWSEARKKQIIESRVKAGQAMTEAFQKAGKKHMVYLQASGVGYYGPSPENVPLDESSPVGSDFLSNVAMQWEASSRLVDSMGIRRVIVRTAPVMTRSGGVLPLMALPAFLFAGGPQGKGDQGISWIHLEDEIRAIRFLIENEKARGPFNLCAPNPVSNADFMRQLCHVLGRPYWFPTPAWLLKRVLGEMSDLILTGQYVIPQKLVALDFSFHFQSIGDVLRDLY